MLVKINKIAYGIYWFGITLKYVLFKYYKVQKTTGYNDLTELVWLVLPCSN